MKLLVETENKIDHKELKTMLENEGIKVHATLITNRRHDPRGNLYMEGKKPFVFPRSLTVSFEGNYHTVKTLIKNYLS